MFPAERAGLKERYMMIHVPNLNTFADLVDRLIVCVNKLAFFEQEKRKISTANEVITQADAHQLAYLDRASRNECEIRNLLKRAIDEKLAEIVRTGEYQVLPDFRTFAPARKTVADILTEQCSTIGEATKELMNKEYP